VRGLVAFGGNDALRSGIHGGEASPRFH